MLDLSPATALMSVEFAAFVVALIVSLGTVPLVRHLARRIGMVDAPDPTRKLHSGQIALGGGVAILFATLTALGLCVALDRFWGLDQLPWGPHWTALTVGCIAIVALGIIDDRFVLRGRQKLLCQVAIAVGIVLTSDVFESVDVLGIHVNFGIFGFLITVAWLLGAINAINLLDGADGMASTIGAILAAGFAAITALKGASLECAISLALAGALIGFLVYNRPPASIFMGDAGSMMIGLLLGTLALWSSQKETAIMAVAPLVVFAIPLFDSVVAILRRVLTGRSLYDADRAHMHHMLLQRFSHRRTLAIVAMLCTISTTAAVMSVAFNRQWIAPLGAAIALGWLILSRSFGYAEVALLCTRTWYFVESFFTASKKCDSHVRHRTWQMQGSRSWDSIWDSLVEFADKHQLAKVKMDLNIAWMHEGYHGAYQRARLPEKSQQVSLRTPIWANDRIVGRLEVIGGGEATSSHTVLEQLIQRLQDLQPEVERLLAEMSAAHGLPTAATTSSEQSQSTPALVEASG